MKTMSGARTALRPLLVILVVAAAASACGLDATAPDTMSATVEVVDTSTQGLTAGVLTAVNGTYGDACKARSGSWSLRVSGTGALAHDALSVVQNVLTLDMFYRVAGASEPGSYLFMLSGSGRISGGIITVKGTSATPIDVTGAAASSWTAPSVTTTVDKTLLVGCWANNASTSSPPATMTEEWDRAAEDKVSCACSVEARPTAGATETRTAAGSGINPTSRLVAIKP